MIVYNMRYRGAIEYEKMVLNILNFHNHVHGVCIEEMQESELNRTVQSYLNKCDRLIEGFENGEGVAAQNLKKELAHFIIREETIGEAY